MDPATVNDGAGDREATEVGTDRSRAGLRQPAAGNSDRAQEEANASHNDFEWLVFATSLLDRQREALGRPVEAAANTPLFSVVFALSARDPRSLLVDLALNRI